MQSRTSFFNGSIFKKSVTRFWPVWGAYFAIWFILVPVVLLANRYDRTTDYVRDFLLNTGFTGGLIMNALFAVFSAMAVWSFAYNTRSAHGTACLPVRREGVFASAVLAGLLPYLAVNVIIAVLALLAELAIGIVDVGATLQWFALASLSYLFFYGFATLCAQLTGNVLVLPAVYAVLNFVFVGAELLARYLCSLFVYGMNQDMDVFALKWLSPFVAILMRCRVSSRSVWNGEYYAYGGSFFSGWHILIIYAVIGLVLLIPALLLYRRRRMETAGDVVAVEVLKPVFRWCMALGCALCLAALFCTLFWENGHFHDSHGTPLGLAFVIVTMLIGALIGWFIAEMLIKKSFRVFRNHWGGLGICCAIIVVLMLACEFDLFGYEKFVPNPTNVESVTLWCNGEFAELDDTESIQTVTALHKSIAANKQYHEAAAKKLYDGPHDPEIGLSVVPVKLNYDLRSGRHVARLYTVYYEPESGSYGDAGLVQAALNCPEAIADRKTTNFPITAENITESTVSSVMTAAECAEAAGYASAEEYILREYCGLSGSELDGLDEKDRQGMIYEAIARYSENGALLEKYYDYSYAVETGASVSALPRATEEVWAVSRATEEVQAVSFPPEDLGSVPFRYEWHFTPAQMMELYETCILPDIADNTLGKVWIIADDEYRNTVYSAEISIHAEQEMIYAAQGDHEEAVPMDFAYFTTTPTVESSRTNAWLAAHGVKLYTLAEGEALILPER